jgi:hypothetical protein
MDNASLDLRKAVGNINFKGLAGTVRNKPDYLDVLEVAYDEALAMGELFKDPDSLTQTLSFNEQTLMVAGAPFGLRLIDL